MGGRTKILLLAGLMFLILLLFTFPLWSAHRLPFQGDVIGSDVTDLNFPARELYSAGLKEGRIPWWNPYIGCGFSQLAEGQGGYLYPLNLLLFFILDPVPAFNFSLIVSLFLSLVFCYLLLRHYGCGSFASLFSATAFTFSGFVMTRLKFTYMIQSLCWIPLAVYGLEKTFDTGKLTWLLLTSLAMAMQLLAGGPQFFLITACALLILFCWRLGFTLAAPREDRVVGNARGILLLVLAFIICIALSLALSAPQLLPQAEGFPYSERSRGIDYSWSLGTPMQPRNLVQFFSPYQYGNPARGDYDIKQDFFWENVAYPGLLTLVIALVALLFLSRRDRTLQVWILIGFLALVAALGDNTPLAGWMWKYLPGFKMFRFWQRFLVLTVMALCILAAKGVDLLLSLFRERSPSRGAVAVLLLFVLLVDLGLFGHGQLSTIDAERMREENRTAQWIAEQLGENDQGSRIAVLGQGDVWEEAVREARGWKGDKDYFYQYLEFLPPNHSSLFRLPGVTQYGDYGIYRMKMLDTMTNYVYLRGEGWTADTTRTAVNILAVEGVKYLITPFVLEEEGLEEVHAVETDLKGVTLRIYRLTAARPRAFMVQRYEVVETGDLITAKELVELMGNRAGGGEGIILEREPDLAFGPGPSGEARITEMNPERVTVEVDTPGGGLLFLSDSYYPGWHAYVDGRERPILRADLAFRAVELEPGRHLVEFVYRPSSLYMGIPICAAALVLILLLLLYHRRTKGLDVGDGPLVRVSNGRGEGKDS